MAATSQVAVVRAAVKAALATRLSGTTVRSFEPGADDITSPSLWLGDARGRQDWDSQSTTDDEFDIPVVCFVSRPGDGDTVAAAAETAALVLMAQVEDYCTDSRTLTGTALVALVTDYEIANTAAPGERRCTITMTIHVRSELVPA